MSQENGAGDAAGTPGRDDDRKVFVGGLSWESGEKELREYFSQFGEIESVNVKTDPTTGRSRGFAFLSNAAAIEKVMNKPEHIISGKKVDPQKAKARHGKIFVGGLKAEMTDDDIKNHFSAMGTVKSASPGHLVPGQDHLQSCRQCAASLCINCALNC